MEEESEKKQKEIPEVEYYFRLKDKHTANDLYSRQIAWRAQKACITTLMQSFLAVEELIEYPEEQDLCRYSITDLCLLLESCLGEYPTK